MELFIDQNKLDRFNSQLDSKQDKIPSKIHLVKGNGYCFVLSLLAYSFEARNADSFNLIMCHVLKLIGLNIRNTCNLLKIGQTISNYFESNDITLDIFCMHITIYMEKNWKYIFKGEYKYHVNEGYAIDGLATRLIMLLFGIDIVHIYQFENNDNRKKGWRKLTLDDTLMTKGLNKSNNVMTFDKDNSCYFIINNKNICPPVDFISAYILSEYGCHYDAIIY